MMFVRGDGMIETVEKLTRIYNLEVLVLSSMKCNWTLSETRKNTEELVIYFSRITCGVIGVHFLVLE
jgi:heme/copper-type cytochrome/quinol oxidase subunit 3